MNWINCHLIFLSISGMDPDLNAKAKHHDLRMRNKMLLQFSLEEYPRTLKNV